MTIILAIGNRNQVIQVSDRRLSWNGSTITDDSNKATCLICIDGRFAIGYSGLAYYESFNTQNWILETLINCAYPEYTIDNIIEKFAQKATNEFINNPTLKKLLPSQKRLSILFTGYLFGSDKSCIYSILVTNFQDYEKGIDYSEAKSNFCIIKEREKKELNENITFIQRIGAWKAMKSDDEKELRLLLQHNKPERALIGKAIRIIRDMADRPTSNSVIGKNLIVVVVPSNLKESCKSLDKCEMNRNVYVMSNQIILLGPENSTMIKDVKITIMKPEDV